MFETALSPAKAMPSGALEALGAIDWLAGVARPTLERLAVQAMVIRMPRGAQIFEQAEVPAFAQFLLAGSIELLAVRGQEDTLIENLPYLVRARVGADATLLLIPAEAFRAAITADHGLCLAMLACQATQFRRQMKLAKAIRLRSAEERAGSFMLALAESRPGDREIRLPREKKKIAARLGMNRETLSRALPSLAEHGLTIVGDRLRVDDLAAARAAFPFDPLIDGRDEIRPLPLGD